MSGRFETFFFNVISTWLFWLSQNYFVIFEVFILIRPFSDIFHPFLNFFLIGQIWIWKAISKWNVKIKCFEIFELVFYFCIGRNYLSIWPEFAVYLVAPKMHSKVKKLFIKKMFVWPYTQCRRPTERQDTPVVPAIGQRAKTIYWK